MKHMKLVLSLVLVLAMVALAGCNGEEKADAADATDPADTAADTTENETPAVEGDTTLSGEVTGSGSTSVQKIALATLDAFHALNPEVEVSYEGTGSSSGVTAANEGTSMFGAASRNIKEGEKEWGLTEVVIAYDGIALIVNPENTAVADLTMEQVKGIYTGEITDWSEVGGDAGTIVVVSREDGSGTRGAFEELVDFEDALVASATIAEGNGNVQTTVAGNPSAIGYVSFTYLNETVKDITVEGVAATTENVLNGTFPISRPFIMIYHEENMSEAAMAYIDFVLSPEGQEIVAEKGGIPVN